MSKNSENLNLAAAGANAAAPAADIDLVLNDLDDELDQTREGPARSRGSSSRRKRSKASNRPKERNPAYRGNLLNRWPRAFARVFDLTWQLVLVLALIKMTLGERSAELMNPYNASFYIILFLSFPCALLIDALIAGIFGNTPAKALVGVKATTSRGESLGFSKHLKRNYGVWTDGFAMGMLPLTLMTFAKQFKRVSGRREAIYDERLHVRVRSGRFTTLRVLLPILAIFLVPPLLSRVPATLEFSNVSSFLETFQQTSNETDSQPAKQ